MARTRHRHRRMTSSLARRGASDTARLRLHGLSFRSTAARPMGAFAAPRPYTFYSPSLLPYEDNRSWSPATFSRSIRTIGGAPARLSAPAAASTRARPGRSASLYYPSAQVTFRKPRSVILCIRRATRRQVLHAFSIAGKSGLRPPRRNANSSISCRG